MRLRFDFLPLLALAAACAQTSQASVVSPEVAPVVLVAPEAPPVPPELPPMPERVSEPEISEEIEALMFKFGEDPSSRTVHLQTQVSQYSLETLAVKDLEGLALDVERCLRLDEQINSVTVIFDLEEKPTKLYEVAFELEGFVDREGWCVDDLLFTESDVDYE